MDEVLSASRCLLTVLGRRARCRGLTAVGCFTSAVGRTHSTPRTPPTAQSPLHHSNSSPGRARPRVPFWRLCEHSRCCDALTTLGCLLLSQLTLCCCVADSAHRACGTEPPSAGNTRVRRKNKLQFVCTSSTSNHFHKISVNRPRV